MTTPFGAPSQRQRPIETIQSPLLSGNAVKTFTPSTPSYDFKPTWEAKTPNLDFLRPKKRILPFDLGRWQALLAISSIREFASLHEGVQAYIDKYSVIPVAYRRIR